jgi:hypothetical protein
MSKVSIIDPSGYSLSILGLPIKGFSKGTFITISRSEPQFSQRRSLKGRTMIINSGNTTHRTLTFTLEKGVSENGWLHALFQLQAKYGIVFPIPVLFRDELGTSTFFCKSAYFQEPEVGYGNEAEANTWELVCNNSTLVIGSNETNDEVSKIINHIRSALQIVGALGVDVESFIKDGVDNVRNMIGV